MFTSKNAMCARIKYIVINTYNLSIPLTAAWTGYEINNLSRFHIPKNQDIQMTERVTGTVGLIMLSVLSGVLSPLTLPLLIMWRVY